MKQTLLVVLTLVVNVCGAQYPVTNYGENQKPIIIKQDTIPVIMLVCDTTLIPEDITTKMAVVNTKGVQYDFGVAKHRIPYVWWQFGYEVKFRYERGGIYLDQNKKPLSKSTVIWISIETKL